MYAVPGALCLVKRALPGTGPWEQDPGTQHPGRPWEQDPGTQNPGNRTVSSQLEACPVTVGGVSCHN